MSENCAGQLFKAKNGNRDPAAFCAVRQGNPLHITMKKKGKTLKAASKTSIKTVTKSNRG